jgi:hypothetical protein
MPLFVSPPPRPHLTSAVHTVARQVARSRSQLNIVCVTFVVMSCTASTGITVAIRDTSFHGPMASTITHQPKERRHFFFPLSLRPTSVFFIFDLASVERRRHPGFYFYFHRTRRSRGIGPDVWDFSIPACEISTARRHVEDPLLVGCLTELNVTGSKSRPPSHCSFTRPHSGQTTAMPCSALPLQTAPATRLSSLVLTHTVTLNPMRSCTIPRRGRSTSL